MHLGRLLILLLLVLKDNLLLVSVVAWNALNLGVRWNFKFVLHIAIEELTLLVKHFLDRGAHVVIELFDKSVLLPVLFHLVLNEAECTVDDLLVEIQLILLLPQVLHRTLNLDWIEVQQLILLLEHFQQALRLHALVQNDILNFASRTDFLLILLLHLLHLISHTVDVLVVRPDTFLSLFLLLCDSLPDLLLLLACISNLAV